MLTRIIGHKFLSQMTFFDFVIGITLGALGGGFIIAHSNGYYLLLSPVILSGAAIIIGHITLKSVWLRKMIDGEPVIVIQNGKIFEDNMRKLHYNIDHLLMNLRSNDIFDIGEVEFAVVEQNGELSVLRKSDALPVTPKDLNLKTKYKGLSSEIIRDGEIVDQNLRQNKLTYEWLFSELASRGIKKVEDVFGAMLSTDGQLYVDLRRDNPPYLQEIEDKP